MLLRFFAEEPEAFTLPADPEAYQQVDDVTLLDGAGQPQPLGPAHHHPQLLSADLRAQRRAHVPIPPPLLAGLEAAGARS
ncbi:MAG: hypothetical protein R3F43_09025 [bacterium]